MRRSIVPVVAGVLLVGACGRGQHDASGMSATSQTEADREALLIRTSMDVSAPERSEPISTGEVRDGSTLGGSPFCVGGTVRDSHANLDPAVEPYGLIARTITCADGTVKLGFTPDLSHPPPPTGSWTQPSSWTIVSGTGAYTRLHGTGKMQVTYDHDPTVPALGTMTGTVTR